MPAPVSPRQLLEFVLADDINAALAVAPKLPGLLGCVIILGDKLGAWGQVELAPL